MFVAGKIIPYSPPGSKEEVPVSVHVKWDECEGTNWEHNTQQHKPVCGAEGKGRRQRQSVGGRKREFWGDQKCRARQAAGSI